MDELSFADVLAIFKRQKKYFLLAFALVAVGGVAWASSWSNYRSVATVEIRAPEISPDVSNVGDVSGSVTGRSLADLRIGKIEQQVKGVESLASIIDKFGLYPDQRKDAAMDVVANKMRGNIKVTLIGTRLANPAATQKISAEQLSAIAFDISFDYQNPRLAQQVTDELVTRFMDEDIKLRRTQAQETSGFLGAQIEALEASLRDQEKQIAAFAEKHGDARPEMLLFNQQAAASIAGSVSSIQSQITANEGVQGSIRAQLAVVPAYSRVLADGQVLTTPEIQLKALEARYATMTAQYALDHPDVVKVRNQIESLKEQVPLNSQRRHSAQTEAQIADIRSQLDAARTTYGPEHPDVAALESRLAALTEKMERTGSDGPKLDLKSDADNPAYLQLVAQLNAASEQHKSLTAQRDALLEQQTKFQMAIAQNPAVTQEMAALTRDYDNSQVRYRQLKEKKMAADMEEQLERERKGQRLQLINPPTLPAQTTPPRRMLYLASVAAAIMVGIAAVILAQFLGRGIAGSGHLGRLVGAAPLVAIPHILSAEETLRLRRMWIAAAAGGGVVVAGAALYLLVR